MSYSEKVSISGTALSFLLYECANSVNSQEGFLIGEVTSEITKHISDSQSDNVRLDTQIYITSVLPLPAVSLFYFPTGRVKEDVLKDSLSDCVNEVVGWYKYRKNSNVKPTFRDKLVSKGLQRYFDKNYGKKTFITCNLTNETSVVGSTHTFTYRFGKINCFDKYEYIENVTANLGEKLTGYKKVHKMSPQCTFNKIVQECNVHNSDTSDAILRIHEAVDDRLKEEAKIAVKNECSIRELEAEIKQMTSILSDKHCVDLHATYNKLIDEKYINREMEMAEACVEALKTSSDSNVLNVSNVLINSNHLLDTKETFQVTNNELTNTCPSPVLMSSSTTKQPMMYATAVKSDCAAATTSKANFSEDLISFDVEEKKVHKPVFVNDDAKRFGDSSPEY